MGRASAGYTQAYNARDFLMDLAIIHQLFTLGLWFQLQVRRAVNDSMGLGQTLSPSPQHLLLSSLKTLIQLIISTVGN